MKLALNEIPLPKYIAIEGPIGVGKTTLANKIAKTFNYDAFLEQPAENPFLKIFIKTQVNLLLYSAFSCSKECSKYRILNREAYSKMLELQTFNRKRQVICRSKSIK